MQVSQMKPGFFYRFTHSGKGEFYAVFQSIEPQADDVDLVRVDIWTGPGSGQEGYANSFARLGGGAKQRPLFTEKLLRSDQIVDINAPSTDEQKRLKESVEHSAKHDYQPQAGEPEPSYTPPPVRRVAAATAAAAASHKMDYRPLIGAALAAAAAVGGAIYFLGA